MNHRYLHIFLAVFFSCISISAKFEPIFKVKTVVIDPGHGGKDPGCHGIKNREKDVALSVALKLGKLIETFCPDVKVIYTRKTDVFVELQERANIANKNKADLFISIHCNASPRKEPYGAETYVMGIKNEKGKIDVAKRENAAILLEDDYKTKYAGFDPNSDESYIIFSLTQNAYLDQSLNLAAKIQKQYSTLAGRVDKGVKRASLWVLWRTTMPSILTEIGFLTNEREERFLGSEKGQEYTAKSIFRAFREYKNEYEGGVIKSDDELEKIEPYKPSQEDTAGTSQASQDTIAAIENAPIENKPLTPNDTVLSDVLEKLKEDQKLKEGNKNEKITKTEKQNSNSETLTGEKIYRIQIHSSDKKVALNDEKFKGLKDVYEYEMNGMFKYTAGAFKTIEDAGKYQSEIRKKGYPDAFVVVFVDGKRVTIK